MKSIRSRLNQMKAQAAKAARKAALVPGTRAERLARVPSERVTYDQLRSRDGDDCQLCGDPIDFDAEHGTPDYRHMDHIWPVSLGGWDVAGNLQAVHGRCNIAKSNRVNDDDLDAWTDFLVSRRIPFSINAIGYPVVDPQTVKEYMQ